MRTFQKAILLFLCFSLLFSATTLCITAEDTLPSPISKPSVSAKSAVLIEGGSGALIYQKNADEIRPMASTTKIMTALVAIEAAPLDTVIKAPACAVNTEGSSIYLVEGEELTLEQLLYALLLESANDAAVTIAVGISGSVEAFADRMNVKAAELGLTHTHFANPHGLDDPNHYTTARELAVITQHAMKNACFRTIVSTRKTTIPHAGTDGVRLLVNHNKLLRLYEDCIGVKTGYTSKSGRCLVSAAERDGVTVIAVTLCASDDWNDHRKMLDYGFSRYTSVLLCQAGEYQIPLSVAGGTDASVMLCNSEALSAVIPTDHKDISYTIEMRRFEYAPVIAGEAHGSVSFFCDINNDGVQEYLGEVTLTAQASVVQKKTKKSFWSWLKSIFGF